MVPDSLNWWKDPKEVPDPESSVTVSAFSSSSDSRHPNPGVRFHNPPQPLIVTLKVWLWVAPRLLLRLEQECSLQVQTVLLNSRKTSTRKNYLQKWKCFQIWGSQCSISPADSSLLSILDCLLNLKSLGVSLNSIKVQLVTIIALHMPVKGFSVFTHPQLQNVSRGSWTSFLQCGTPSPSWDLNLVFTY